MPRTFVIGDIHGGLRAIPQVLERAGVEPADQLIFLGDYVDGWSESAQVISFLISLSERQSCIFLKGNHDLWGEEWLQSGNADRNWLQHGGQATARSYAAIDKPTRQRHLQFFEQMKLFWIDGEQRLFVHAGFTSFAGPEWEPDKATLSWDRSLWETAQVVGSAGLLSTELPQRLRLFNEIFIGHTPTLHLQETKPLRRANVWNIDTGAAFTGRLTIMDVHTHQWWQSDPLTQLYPNEDGRNRR